MNAFPKAVRQVFQGAAKASRTFPAAVINALAFTVVAMVRIYLDWPEQEAYEFLLNCLSWSFALGAIFSLAVLTLAYSRLQRTGKVLFANSFGVAASLVTFCVLSLWGGSEAGVYGVRTVSDLAAARVVVGMLISILAFLVLAGVPKERPDFARAFFMTHKAFFLALLYGAVIMGGLSGVAGAVQALLYHGMSSKVYQDLGALTGFVAFTIFLGYFPDFRGDGQEERREIAQKQPRFIEILLGYILVPILLALTAVLLIWAGKTVATGSWPNFEQLFRIAGAYAAGGIWLHVMVTHHASRLAGFFRRAYPIATFLILAFELWAVVLQLNQSGLKTAEYFFLLVWIFTGVSSALLLIRKERAHLIMAALLCVLSIFAVLPGVGYQVLPVNVQVNRLEKLLESNGMLEEQKLIPAKTEPSRADQEAITDAVFFLSDTRDAKLPSWFDRELSDNTVFKEKLGFDQCWPDSQQGGSNAYFGGNYGTYLTLPSGALDISGYRWLIQTPEDIGKGTAQSVTVQGERGSYRMAWAADTLTGIPSLKITLEGQEILQQDMGAYLRQLEAKYPPSGSGDRQASLADLSLKLECPQVSVLLVFRNVNINVDVQRGTTNYWMSLSALYLSENPA